MDGGTCPDGSECTDDLDCLDREPVAADQCARTPTGSEGCDPRWPQVCAMTTLGVRRCMRPCDSFGDMSCSSNCLPDPEDPSTFVCWLGGAAQIGDACETHYDCQFGACNDAGVCAYRCGEGLRPCSETMVRYGPHICRDTICTPAGG